MVSCDPSTGELGRQSVGKRPLSSRTNEDAEQGPVSEKTNGPDALMHTGDEDGGRLEDQKFMVFSCYIRMKASLGYRTCCFTHVILILGCKVTEFILHLGLSVMLIQL